MARLDAPQRDALRWAFHAGIGEADAVMSKLLGEEVALSVPRLNLMSSAEAARHLRSTNAGLYRVRQPFRKGAFNGDALFVFPGFRSLDIVRTAVDRLVEEGTLSSMEQDAMAVVGHIILNSCISTVSQLVCKDVSRGFLSLELGDGEKILGTTIRGHWALFLRTTFSLQSGPIESFVVFVLNTASLDALCAALSNRTNDVPLSSHFSSAKANNCELFKRFDAFR